MLVDFNAGKTQLVLVDQSNNSGSIDVKMDGSVPESKSSFKMMGLTFYSNVDCGSYIIFITRTAVLAGAPSCCLELSDKLSKPICWTVGPSLAASL